MSTAGSDWRSECKKSKNLYNPIDQILITTIIINNDESITKKLKKTTGNTDTAPANSPKPTGFNKL